MGAIQSSINTALGVAAIASGLTNKKQVDKAQDKLDKSEENLAKKESQLAKTTEEKNEAIKQQAKDAKVLSEYKDEDNMKYGKNTFDVSNETLITSRDDVLNALVKDGFDPPASPEPNIIVRIFPIKFVKPATLLYVSLGAL